ncbi:hypothetical protein E2C01_091526 [Portunus trituberculatus]|uniref:Uncharacterized protein n=1 Tax=Portunus trituberculatus TaxID=210409 RepID=A0A5B7JPL9_PORTR|nr:hypothetical protein [Portunus trituberculatus]
MTEPLTVRHQRRKVKRFIESGNALERNTTCLYQTAQAPCNSNKRLIHNPIEAMLEWTRNISKESNDTKPDAITSSGTYLHVLQIY